MLLLRVRLPPVLLEAVMIYTIGHSTYTPEKFREVAEPLDVVLDIRSHPGSNKWPHFNKEQMECWLPEAGIDYVWEPGLGGWTADHLSMQDRFAEYNVDISVYAKGRFPKQRIAGTMERTSQPSWTNQGLWDYQFFMILDEFLESANDLIELGKSVNVGIMCCELLWWKCHRSMVADFLVFRGSNATHLQPQLKSHAEAIGNRLERYHPDVLAAWKHHG